MDELDRMNFRLRCLELAERLASSFGVNNVVAEAEKMHQWLTAPATKTEADASPEA